VLPNPITGGEGLAAPLQEPHPHYWLFEPQMAKLHWHCCSFSATRTLHATVLWLVISQKLLMWLLLPSVLWHCRLGGRKGIQPVKNWVVGCWRGYLSELCADLHMAQLMPLPLTVSCFSEIQNGFTFLVPAHLGSPGKRAVKRVCVCVCITCTVLLKTRTAGMLVGVF